MDSVQAGKVTHKLKLSGNEELEVYENPGATHSASTGSTVPGAKSPPICRRSSTTTSAPPGSACGRWKLPPS